MRKRKNKDGFSLVELMMAFAIIVIIFAAIVPQFRAIRNSWTCNEAKAEIIQNGRVLVEHITRSLAAAEQIIAVSPDSSTNGFITFTDNNDVQKRYMLAGGYVVFGNLGSEAELAGPVDRFQIRCYSLSDLNTPTTDANVIRLVQVETDFPNDDALGTDKTFSSEVFIQANAKAEQSVIDIFVESDQPSTAFDYAAGDYGCNAVIEVDSWQGGSGEIHGLLWFKDIVGDANGQVPQDTEITEAKIKLWYVNHNNNNAVYFYRMWVPWTETSTWNSIGGGVIPGTNCDPDPCRVEAYLGGSVQTTVEIDVTDIVRDWINGEENYGFGIINSSNNNIQFAAAENTTGTDANTPILEVRYQQSSDVNIIGSWVTGLTHAKEPGTNRALIFIAQAEETATMNLSSVTYGGQTMTKIIDKVQGTSTYVYAAAYRLGESDIAAATSGTFVPTWSVTPTDVNYISVFLSDVNQTTPIGDSNSNSVSNSKTLSTSVLSTNDGDMVIDAATCSNTGTYTANNGFTKAYEGGNTNFDCIDGYKTATGAGETPSVKHQNNSRQVLIGFVVKALPPVTDQQWTFGGEDQIRP